MQGPLPLMEEMYAKHGEVFTIPLLHKRMTFVLGPHASPHFFNATDDKMSQTEVCEAPPPSAAPAGPAVTGSPCGMHRWLRL